MTERKDVDAVKVAFLAAPEGTEQVELTEPWEAVSAVGGEPRLVSTRGGEIQAFHHLDKADTFPVDVTCADATVEDYNALVLPGGVANPDYLRRDPQAVTFVKGFFQMGMPVASICHAAWLLIEADVVRGRTLTSYPSLQTDLRNAGATWVDQEVCQDSNGPNTLITSRGPRDLPAFNEALVQEFAKASEKAGQR